MNESKRVPEIFPPALCAAGCRKVWEKWCKWCNIVFCAAHIERDQHKCRPDEVRPYPGKKVARVKMLPKPAPDLFVPPPSNGVASSPNGH